MNENISIELLKKAILSSEPPHDMRTRVIAIDGCGGAGKTTLAERLSKALNGCSVIHTDDFASSDNPMNWYQRMIDQVLKPLKENSATKYQRYDWHLCRLAEWVDVQPGGIILLEGVSSSRREFRPYLSLSIFIETARKERLRRGLERDGENALEQWQEWMKEEDKYIERDHPEQFADFIVNGEKELKSI